MLIAALSGHPPSRAQSAITAEDAKQDSDITHDSMRLNEHAAKMEAMELVIVQQGQDNARLDTKVTILFSILGAIQGGGIVVTVVGKKRS